jgi:hypothetical protein
MLSKVVCKRCRVTCDGADAKWNATSEMRWEKCRAVICIAELYRDACQTGTEVGIDDQPPENCPFKLEHLMAEKPC